MRWSVGYDYWSPPYFSIDVTAERSMSFLLFPVQNVTDGPPGFPVAVVYALNDPVVRFSSPSHSPFVSTIRGGLHLLFAIPRCPCLYFLSRSFFSPSALKIPDCILLRIFRDRLFSPRGPATVDQLRPLHAEGRWRGCGPWILLINYKDTGSVRGSRRLECSCFTVLLWPEGCSVGS
ncbi:hypothetical protein P152DRAFT_93351 [Eremomyces bilateralis CBS 781.70]|uniref:Uncharacterized protein n=1 Tax=Eremomyces bilateralis CBS 781.70 TaxID=1392243 RepID=A0A6G1FY40_9PEZI|nr:uncharacterized protein P152DRAFT_93351 [Eremomyces bilateralis CBS 781.70]KAF1810678.1 hypothetical protein P152DRAFT_93351 [Eremomyces bilateralis CBS 781.70]